MTLRIINPDAIQSDGRITDNAGNKFISVTAILGWRLMSEKKVVWVHSNKINDAFHYLPMSNLTMISENAKKYAEFLVSARLHNLNARVQIGDIKREFERVQPGNEPILIDNTSIEDSDIWINSGTKAKKSENSYIGPIGRRTPTASTAKIRTVSTDHYEPGTNPIPYGALREKLDNLENTDGKNYSGQLAPPMQWHRYPNWDHSIYYEFTGLLPNGKIITGHTPGYSPKCFLINSESSVRLEPVLECLWFVPEKRLGWSTYRIWHKVPKDFDEDKHLIAWELSENNSADMISHAIMNLQEILRTKDNLDDFHNNSLLCDNLIFEDLEENFTVDTIWDRELSQGKLYSQKNNKIKKIKEEYKLHKAQLFATGILVGAEEQSEAPAGNYDDGSWELIEKATKQQELRDYNFKKIIKDNFIASNITFENCKFTKCNFKSFVFEKICFINCDFSNCSIQKTVFLECEFNQCKFIKCDSLITAFEKSKLNNTEIIHTSEIDLNFNHSSLKSITLFDCKGKACIQLKNTEVEDLSMEDMSNMAIHSIASTIRETYLKSIRFYYYTLTQSRIERMLIGKDVYIETMEIQECTIIHLAANDRLKARRVKCMNSTISGGLRNSTFNDSNFVNSRMNNLAMTESLLTNCVFNRCDIKKAKLNNITWSNVRFENSDMEQTKFNSPKGEIIKFINCNLNDAIIHDLNKNQAIYEDCLLPE